jgi:hypothetical protein
MAVSATIIDHGSHKAAEERNKPNAGEHGECDQSEIAHRADGEARRLIPKIITTQPIAFEIYYRDPLRDLKQSFRRAPPTNRRRRA